MNANTADMEQEAGAATGTQPLRTNAASSSGPAYLPLPKPQNKNPYHSVWATGWLQSDKVRTTVLVNLASVMERVDEQLLPSVYREIGRTFHARPTQLAYLTSCRAFVQAVSSPLGGFLGHHYDRTHVICAGCLLWGCMTAIFSQITWLPLGYACWAVNGLGLSLVIPSTQSLVADYYMAEDRGKAFGLLYLTGAVGGMLGALFATNIAAIAASGWKIAFASVAVASWCIGALTYAFARDPHWSSDGRRLAKASQNVALQPAHSLRGFLRELKSIMRPTFGIIIAQGVLGSAPWNALVFLTLYMQLIGMSDFAASFLMATFMGGTALGGLFGGALGDLASRYYPNHGRILVCQFSVFSGIPLSVILLKVLPYDGSGASVALYASLLLAMGLLISWAAPACNSPIFAEIVPEHMRTMIYAYDRCFEGAVASMGAPIVSLLAEKVFGFTGTAETGEVGAVQTDLDKARSLGNALLVCTVVPWGLCLLFYTGLHLVYPSDRRKAQLAAAAAETSVELAHPAASAQGVAEADLDQVPLVAALPHEVMTDSEGQKLVPAAEPWQPAKAAVDRPAEDRKQ